MSRVGASELRKFVATDSDNDVSAFIAAASSLTNQVESCDSDNELSSSQLYHIELMLSAHFYTMLDPLYKSRKTADASATFQGDTGMALDATHYGQNAKVMDTTGCLAKLDKQAKEGKITAGVTWLGLPPSDQTDYVDRD